MEIEIIVDSDGSIRAIYSDDVADVLREVGALDIRRASHVEPDQDGRWTADMTPVGGPVERGFTTRSGALSWEVAWLSAHNVPQPSRS